MSLCECGCGFPTPLAERTRPDRGWVTGQPLRFLHGHNRRGKHNPRGPLNGKYKPHSRIVDRDGYVWVLVHPGHTYFSMAVHKAGSCYVSEHHLVMAKEEGRALTTEEVVHHEDSDPGNNDPANLRLFPSQTDHAYYHSMLVKEALCL